MHLYGTQGEDDEPPVPAPPPPGVLHPHHIDLPHPGIVEYSNPNATTGLTRGMACSTEDLKTFPTFPIIRAI